MVTFVAFDQCVLITSDSYTILVITATVHLPSRVRNPPCNLGCSYTLFIGWNHLIFTIYLREGLSRF